MIDTTLKPFNEEIDSMLSGHCYQYFMNKEHHDEVFSEEQTINFHHKFLKDVIPQFHKNFLSCLEDKNFNIYMFFSKSKINLRKELERQNKNDLVNNTRELLYGAAAVKHIRIKPEEIKEYELFFRLVEHYYKKYYDYFEELYSDYKAGLIAPNNINLTENNSKQILNTQRLKTNLTVPQLALLFKMLDILKPKIFENRTEAELHRFISANFETKKSGEDGISTDKLRILFNQPDSKSIDFWEKHLHTLSTELKKFKEK